jgi:F0F1-type ATP synthase assembly protein I
MGNHQGKFEALAMLPKGPTPRDLGFYFSLAQVGLVMVVPIGLGVVLDSWLKTFPWITIAGAVVGFTAGLLHLISMLNRRNQAGSQHKEEQDSP